MERFPALDLILRYGARGSIVVSLAVAILLGLWAWPVLGWFALVVAIGVGALVLLLCRSFVELVTIITEMLVPR